MGTASPRWRRGSPSRRTPSSGSAPSRRPFTAIAVMQLRERGILSLDAPASDYLRSFRLVPAEAAFPPVTVRHLLTHTAGIGYWRRLPDLLRPGIGSGVQAGGGPRPSPRPPTTGGVCRLRWSPGTKWVYSNHGFAALGQIVEDVTGQPLDRYLREHVFEPLGMRHTRPGPVRTGRSPRLATGYVLRSRGLRPAADGEVPAAGGGAAYSTSGDLARYAAALLRQGSGEHGRVLEPGTVALMFEPHFRLDPRVPGMGLGFLLGEEAGHRTVGHDGVVSGFLAQLGSRPTTASGSSSSPTPAASTAAGAPETLGVGAAPPAARPPGGGHPHRHTAAPGDLGRALRVVRPRPGSGHEPVHQSPDRRRCRGDGPPPPAGAGRFPDPGPGTAPRPAPATRTTRMTPPSSGSTSPRWARPRSGSSSGTGSGPGAGGTRLLMDGMSLRKRPGVRNPRSWAGTPQR